MCSDCTSTILKGIPHRVKDRLQSAGPDGTLVLGDVYRTYQARFGSNKPLGMREFYTVLKIALPQGEQAEDHELNTVVLRNIMWNPNSSGTVALTAACFSPLLTVYHALP